LAIELAAARARMMSPSQIAQRLDQRFRLLTGGGRTAVERHRTLQATVSWSYELLDGTERSVFQRLSTLAGSFDLDAAEAIAAGGAVQGFEVLCGIVFGSMCLRQLQVSFFGVALALSCCR